MYLNSREKPRTQANWRLRNWLMLALIYAITGLLWLREDRPLALIDPPATVETALAVEVTPENDAAQEQMARGDLYFDQGNLTAAREAYEEAVAVNPELATAYARWGRLLVLRFKYEEALIRTQRGVELAPEDAEVLAAHSMALSYNDDTAGALQYAQEAIAVDPMYSTGYAALAEAYFDQGQYDLALATAQQAVELDSYDVWAWRNLGWVRENLGYYQEAIDAYQQGINATPLSFLYVRIGLNQRVLGNTDAAIAAFQEAINVDPRNPLAYTALGQTYINLDDYASATTYLEEGIAQDPTYPNLYAQLGLVFYRQRNFEAAIEQFEKAVSFGLSTPDAYYTLGLAYAYLDQCEQAVPWLQRALDAEPESPPALEGMRICNATPVEAAVEPTPEAPPAP